jgi:hypothetical protein
VYAEGTSFCDDDDDDDVDDDILLDTSAILVGIDSDIMQFSSLYNNNDKDDNDLDPVGIMIMFRSYCNSANSSTGSSGSEGLRKAIERASRNNNNNDTISLVESSDDDDESKHNRNSSKHIKSLMMILLLFVALLILALTFCTGNNDDEDGKDIDGITRPIPIITMAPTAFRGSNAPTRTRITIRTNASTTTTPTVSRQPPTSILTVSQTSIPTASSLSFSPSDAATTVAPSSDVPTDAPATVSGVPIEDDVPTVAPTTTTTNSITIAPTIPCFDGEQDFIVNGVLRDCITISESLAMSLILCRPGSDAYNICFRTCHNCPP